MRQHFGMTNVKSDIKTNYKAAESLMLSLTKANLCEAFMEWSGMETLNAVLSKLVVPSKDAPATEWKDFMDRNVKAFVREFVMFKFDREKLLRAMKTRSCTQEDKEIPDKRISIEPETDVALVELKDNTYTGIGCAKVINLVLVDGNFVQIQGKTPVKITSVLTSDKLKTFQIVLWPTNLSAIRQPSNLPTPQSDIPPTSEGDGVMNYSLQVLQLGFLLMQLNDTEKEGDGNRSLLNWKILMLYIRCRPRGMKYAFEAMRIITMTKALYTARMAHRVIHGQFVNHKGGAGNNVANDLKMEHIVKNNKVILNGLCANKTLNAVQRSSSAAYGVHQIVNNFDKQSNIAPDSTAHTHANKQDDELEMIEIIHKTKPFSFQRGREFKSYGRITKSPLEKLNISLLSQWLTNHKNRLFQSQYYQVEVEDEEDKADKDDVSDVEKDSDDEF